MPRPDIIDECYASFNKNLVGVDMKKCSLFINIDPFPYKTVEELVEINKLRSKVIDVCNNYFKKTNYRFPGKANYALAYKHVWSMARTGEIFNLEDDWELLCPVNLKRIIDRNRSKYEIVLRAYTYRYPTCCTSPAVLKRVFYHNIAKGMNERQNPECQIHKGADNKYGIFVPNKYNCDQIELYVSVYPRCKKKTIVADIGREWFEGSPFINPIEQYRIDLLKFYEDKGSAAMSGKIFPLKMPKIVKKVDFVAWDIKHGVNLLEWLREYNERV